MKQFCFIYNPAANRNHALRKYEQLVELTAGWKDTDHRVPESYKELQDTVKKAKDNYEAIIACGGDGTIQNVAASLVHSDTLLGIIPLGSGNDFIKSLGIPRDPVKAMQLIRQKRSKKVDAGVFNSRLFVNTLGFGFDGSTNRYALQSNIANGTLRYGLAALKANFRRELFGVRVRMDGRKVYEGKSMMLTFANGKIEGGNFKVSPDSSVSDGQLELLMVRPVPQWLLPFLLPLFMTPLVKRIPYLKYYSGKRFDLLIDQEIKAHADGEQLPEQGGEFSVKILPDALRVIC